ncbi:MAG TPA: ATP-binding cassette domain-containing protein [Nocardioidaceae bacterium]|nr:ATP-binding cassette domain-containing protein [Nocardioidaceae bacterium]
MSDNVAVEAVDLVKRFGDNTAVDGISFAVPQGSVLGMLGPNGAGKTTTVRMLTTLSRPTSGTGRVAGYDILQQPELVRRSMGLTGQAATVDELLTARENLRLIGGLSGMPRSSVKPAADALLERFTLTEAADRVVKTYSGGMRRRLDLAVSLIAAPPVLFLDEPTTGLDPRSRNQVWEIARALAAEGTTILLCTQYLEEADQLASGIAVIDRGRVIAEGTPGQLKASVGGGALHVRLLDAERRPEAAALLERAVGAVELPPDPAALVVASSDAERAAAGVAELARAGVGIAEFSLAQPSLDEVFLSLTGHATDESEPTLEEQAS